MKLKTSILLLFGMMTTVIAVGQNKLYVYETDNSMQSYLLTEIRKITFTDESMFINQLTEETASYPVDDIAYLSFIESTVSIPVLSTENVSVYPNPAGNEFTIDHSGIVSELKVFDSQGRTILHEFPETEKIKIKSETFPTGIYLLQITSGNEKIVKKLIKN
ncbi:T9SS type A sorting domain-containing protein [Bacteroidales bacterium OttesenSCG-928-I21]|nr:T9SS type A sorting domain-containing protein [Bacteroidales bacterium OttesenSCG-928-I21]